MTNLSDKQLAAATSSAALTICIAGPGAGKTKTLVHRISHLIAGGVRPSDIVAITFTNDAADEIERRVDAALHEAELSRHPKGTCLDWRGIKLGYIGTLHGYVLRLVGRFGSLVGIEGRLVIADEETAEAHLAKAVAETAFTGRASDLEIAKRQFAAPHPERPKTKAQIAAFAYHRLMRSSGMTDFDGLLALGLALAKVMEADGSGRLSLGEHLLVDEFQDSGPEDAAIYEALPFTHKFYIGDADQSIYGFRGGSPEHLLALARGQTESPVLAEVFVLTDNYRSSKEILDAADDLISHNTDRVAKRMTSIRGPSGAPICLGKMRNEVAEMMFIAQSIQLALADGIDPEQCAVLCRNNADADAVRACVESFGLPLARQKRPKMPADWKECRRLVGFHLRPDDDLLALWFCERQFGKDQAAKMALEARKTLTSIADRWMLVDRTPGGNNLLNELARGGISQESIGLVREELAKLQGISPEDRLPALSLALAGLGRGGDETAGIHVGTIHSAKGREWRAVWLPGWNDGFLPRKAGDEEERRLAYVAMTRAKDRLTITWPLNRRPHPNTSQTVPAGPSRYLEEAGLSMEAYNDPEKLVLGELRDGQ